MYGLPFLNNPFNIVTFLFRVTLAISASFIDLKPNSKSLSLSRLTCVFYSLGGANA